MKSHQGREYAISNDSVRAGSFLFADEHCVDILVAARHCKLLSIARPGELKTTFEVK